MHERIMWIVKRFRDGPTYYILTDRPTNQQIGKTSYRGAQAHLKNALLCLQMSDKGTDVT